MKSRRWNSLPPGPVAFATPQSAVTLAWEIEEDLGLERVDLVRAEDGFRDRTRSLVEGPGEKNLNVIREVKLPTLGVRPGGDFLLLRLEPQGRVTAPRRRWCSNDLKGVAFISGVFISYFVPGLGLVEVVSRIEAFHTAAMLLNWALAIACLVIAYLSIRDARLAREGRLQDMALQLPGFLKSGIRDVIRTGAKSTHFVVAAFLSGLIIAALELACTGQVYLPTIVYAMKTGIASATAFLLLYNVAFIVPLVIIFILAWRGMKSEALIRFQKNHTATVKYALGALFLLLFFMIVWSGRL